MAEPPDPPKWRPRPSPVAAAFRGRAAAGKLYCQMRVEDVTRHRRRAFGACAVCHRRAPIHPVYLNFRFGRPLHPGTFLTSVAKRLKCSACGNGIENWIEVEAAEGEPIARG